MTAARGGGRRGATKDPRQALYVVVEGPCERSYLEGLRGWLRVPSKLLVVEDGCGTSAKNVKRRLDRVRRGEGRALSGLAVDQLWGVVDTEWADDWKAWATRPSLDPETGEMGVRGRIRWAISSSSFERWLLLHFLPAPPTLDARHSANRVGDHLPGYSSESKVLTEQQLGILLDRTTVALGNAWRWRESGESGDNFTDVDLLVRAIITDVAQRPDLIP